MQRPRQELLAGPRFAGDQNRDIEQAIFSAMRMVSTIGLFLA